MNTIYDYLGHELHVGNWIEWTANGLTIIGEITNITDSNDKTYLIIATKGCRGTIEQRDSLKKTYKLSSKRITYLLNINKKL